MNRSNSQQWIRAALGALVWAAALAALGCDSDVRVSHPTSPHWTDWEPGERSLQISGTLSAEEDALIEATLLFDGRELAGARSTCHRTAGCPELRLAGSVRTGAGHHTVTFRVLDQAPELVEYRAEGSVALAGPGLGLGGVTLPLGPKRARLGAGDEVSFEFDFVD